MTHVHEGLKTDSILITLEQDVSPSSTLMKSPPSNFSSLVTISHQEPLTFWESFVERVTFVFAKILIMFEKTYRWIEETYFSWFINQRKKDAEKMKKWIDKLVDSTSNTNLKVQNQIDSTSNTNLKVQNQIDSTSNTNLKVQNQIDDISNQNLEQQKMIIGMFLGFSSSLKQKIKDIINERERLNFDALILNPEKEAREVLLNVALELFIENQEGNQS